MSQRDEFPAVESLTIPGWVVAAAAAAPTILLAVIGGPGPAVLGGIAGALSALSVDRWLRERRAQQQVNARVRRLATPRR